MMEAPDLYLAAQNVRVIVTDVDGVHTNDQVTIFGKPESGRRLVLGLHEPGRAITLAPTEEGNDDEMHCFGSADDGRIEGYRFFTGDGIAVKECMRHGLPVYFMTGRNSPAVRQRAKDLGVDCRFGIKDKVAELERILAERGNDWSQVLFLGNDIQDLSLLRRAGFSAAPADAAAEVLREVMYVAPRKGGEGAVRDVLQFVLAAKGMWEKIVQRERTLG